jgi:hypothetical protein
MRYCSDGPPHSAALSTSSRDSNYPEGVQLQRKGRVPRMTARMTRGVAHARTEVGTRVVNVPAEDEKHVWFRPLNWGRFGGQDKAGKNGKYNLPL